MNYNKKNNTYFLYEMLIRKYISFIPVSNPKSEMILNLIKNKFRIGSNLGREKILYEQIVFLEGSQLSEEEKLYVMRKCKDEYSLLNKKNIVSERSSLLNESFKIIDESFLNEKIEDYQLYANIYHYFNSYNYSDALILEKKILEYLRDKKEKMKKKNKRNILEVQLSEGSKYSESGAVLQKLLEDNNPGAFLFILDSISEYKKVLLEHSVCSECEVCDVEMKSKILKIYHKLEELKKRELQKEDLDFLVDVSELVFEFKKSE